MKVMVAQHKAITMADMVVGAGDTTHITGLVDVVDTMVVEMEAEATLPEEKFMQ
jgi:hypothetical protein